MVNVSSFKIENARIVYTRLLEAIKPIETGWMNSDCDSAKNPGGSKASLQDFRLLKAYSHYGEALK